jgi:phosphomannomutase
MEFSENKHRMLIDGVRIMDGNVTVLLLPHKEDELFVVTAEADDVETAQQHCDMFAELITQWRFGRNDGHEDISNT